MLSISIGLEEGARRRPAERVDEIALPVARLRNELADEDHGQESDRQAEKGRGHGGQSGADAAERPPRLHAADDRDHIG